MPRLGDNPWPAPPVAGRLLWVGNLTFSVRPSEVRNVFAAAAGCDREDVWCSLSRDREGRSTGYGTVRFSTEEEAARAIATLNGTEVDGRIITVRMDKYQN